MANVCVRMCESMYQLPTRVVCIILVLLQGGVLDYYLIHQKGVYWYAWIVADIAVAFVFIMAFVISYRHLMLVRKSSSRKTPIQTGSLPLGYFAWLSYASALAARVAIIYKEFAWKLDEANFFGPNTLKMSISLAGFVFLLLLLSHHDALTGSDRKHYIEELTATVVFDVLDSVDCLDVLFDKEDIEDFPDGLHIAIISIACINFILPALPLITLSSTHFGHRNVPRYMVVLHKLMLVFFVNLPLLIIRLLLWHALSKEISIFPVKNVVVIFLVFHDLYEKQKQKYTATDGEELEECDLNSQAFACPDD